MVNFSMPSDREVLQDLKLDAKSIKFIGSGSFCQKLDSIKYSRTFQVLTEQDLFQKAIYYKNGRSWRLSEVVTCDPVK